MQGLVTVFGGSGFIGAQVVRALAKRGYRVIRFWNTDVLKNTDGVVEQILLELESSPTSPRPSPP